VTRTARAAAPLLVALVAGSTGGALPAPARRDRRNPLASERAAVEPPPHRALPARAGAQTCTRAAAPLLVALVALLACGGFDLLRSRNRAVARGNELLKAGKAKEALVELDRARAQLPDDPGVRYNRGLALYELGQLDEARAEFQRAGEGHAPLKGLAYFNQGNVLAKQEKWQEAVESYRRALTADPKLHDAKWNLEVALRKLKEEKKKEEQKKQDEEQKKQEEQKKKDEEQKKKEQEQQQQQQGRDGGTPQPQSQPQPEQKPQQPDSKKDQQQQQPKPEEGKDKGPDHTQPEPKPAPEDKPGPAQRPAERESVDAVLDALEKHEKNLPLERLRMRTRRKPDKDW
jgi:tetratricopeptide (TPR) repeat protein